MDSQESSKKENENLKKENKKAIPLKNRYTLKQKLDVIKEAEITSIMLLLLNMESIELQSEIGLK